MLFFSNQFYLCFFIFLCSKPGYQTAYSQLAFAGKKERDPFSGTIPDAKVYLAQSLQKLSSSEPGKVRPTVVIVA